MIRYQKSDVRSSYCSIIEGAELERSRRGVQGAVEGWDEKSDVKCEMSDS